MNNLSAIILAGGKSSRMGTDKLLIEIEGVPLIQRTIQIAQNLASLVCVVTSTPDRYQSYLNGCQAVRENAPEGALVGFAKGLAEVNTDWVLLLACDLPKLEIEPLREWSDRLADIPAEAIAYLPRSNKGWEPLCGFYRRSSLPDLVEYIAGGGRSFQKWLEGHQVVEVELKDVGLLFNCNTPADLDCMVQNSRNNQK